MGEYAEMMLDGTCCASCGEFMGHFGEPDGFPGYCSPQCASDAGIDMDPVYCPPSARRNARDTPCPICKRKFRGEQGAAQHMRDAHSGSSD